MHPHWKSLLPLCSWSGYGYERSSIEVVLTVQPTLHADLIHNTQSGCKVHNVINVTKWQCISFKMAPARQQHSIPHGGYRHVTLCTSWGYSHVTLCTSWGYSHVILCTSWGYSHVTLCTSWGIQPCNIMYVMGIQPSNIMYVMGIQPCNIMYVVGDTAM
jgi:hypothetical protein